MTRTEEDNRDRSVAIIGMSCRFPGSSGVDELWELLRDGVDATSSTPAERYDADALHCEHPRPGSIRGRRAGYIDGIADFDAAFFDISAAEAVEMDPQQRLLLMVLWEALEDAGVPAGAIEGSRTGVFVGNAQSDYLELQRRRGEERTGPWSLHNYRSLLAGRLSHSFDLRGPSVVIDSACSSSLIAVHSAVQSLRAGEVPLAIAAGVNLKLLPDEAMVMTQAGTLARDGRSKFGDASADGYAPSDGAGVVVLKPLADAVAARDRIRAVIRGSAVGNDGRLGDSLLTPSVHGQAEVLERAYADAGVHPVDVDFVEAHGTASAVDDAVELEALGKVLGTDRAAGRPLLVGSGKTNTGHAQAAAGVAGLIKAVLCLEHDRVPASLHFETPSPRVAWDDLPLTVPTRLQELPDLGRPAVAGVSGQGMSCLYAHLVVSAAVQPVGSHSERDAMPGRTGSVPAVALDRGSSGASAIYPLVLSARTPNALADLARAYAEFLGPAGRGAGFALRDICWSAAARRHHHAHRTVVMGSSHDEMIAALSGERTQAAGAFADDGGRDRARVEAAARYLEGRRVDWAEVFADDAVYVPLPTYPWQLQSYWLGRTDGASSSDADSVLRRHARTVFGEDSSLSDIGIDSLSVMRIVAELARDRGFEADASDLAELRTVGEFRSWYARSEVQAI